jgi:hypothetical protein
VKPVSIGHFNNGWEVNVQDIFMNFKEQKKKNTKKNKEHSMMS